MLGLLSEVAAGQPLLCLVDDAQWLDQASAQALAFVARRLDAESVALLFGTRDPAGEGHLPGCPELAVAGLADADARALLASVLPGRLDERVRDRIIAESGGNPLALLELPRGMTPTELAGGFGLPGAGRWRAGSRRASGGGSRRCPRRPGGCCCSRRPSRPATRRCCGGRPGISASAPRTRRPAEADGLLTFGARVMFRHPLVRSAVYQAAPAGDRRAPTRPSPRPPTRAPIPIAGPGTGPRPQPGPTRTSPPSSSDPPAGRRHAAGSRRRPRSWNARPR